MLNKTLNIVEGQYFRDLMDQPRAIESTLEQLRSDDRWNTTRRFIAQRKWRRIVLTGMGSSYHTFHPFHLSLIEAGLSPIMMETSELIHYGLPLCDDDTLVIVVSQSGGSAETLRLLELNRRSPVLAITNTPGSPLAERAGLALLIQAGPEFSVSCKTYVAGMLALQWLSQVFAGAEEKATLQRLEPAARSVDAYLKHWLTYAHELAQRFAGARHLLIAGRGDSLAAVGTGALIIKESARFHAEGMSCAALRHGAMEMLGASTPVLIFAGHESTRELNRQLVRDLVARSVRCDEIGGDAELGSFRLPSDDGLLRPLYEILPIELITLALAGLSGREAGVFEYAKKVTVTE